MKGSVKTKKNNKPGRKEYFQSYAMLLPSIIGISFFVIYPIFWVIRWCLFRYDGYLDFDFVGLYNFVRAFTRDPQYWLSVLNTFILSVGKLMVELPLALALAYLLDQKYRLSNFFRTMYFLPTIISVAIIGIVFYYIFASYNGIANEILMSLHLIKRPIDWFSSKWLAILVVGIASIWQNFGLNMVFFLTGLQSISKDIYESADIDGVSGSQKFFYITVPMLGPILQVIVMIALLGSLKVTDLVLVLTGGRPAGQSEVMMTYIYKLFFGTGGSGGAADYGYAAALVLITSAILGVVTFFYLRLTKKSSSIY